MKNSYLVYKQINGVRQLSAVARAEWNTILKENRQCPPEERRHFIKDCLAEGKEWDCMYIEVSAEEHRRWSSKNTLRQRNRKAGLRYVHLSMDAAILDTGIESLHESIPADYDLERIAIDEVLIEELRQALRTWKPWAEEMLGFYMSGAKRSCTNQLCQEYQLGARAIQKRKVAFEKFVLDFLKK